MPKKHPPELKAAAMAALLTGESVRGAARAFGIPKQTVSDWKRQAWGIVLPDLKKSGIKIDLGPFRFR